jgi:hypothetical protein
MNPDLVSVCYSSESASLWSDGAAKFSMVSIPVLHSNHKSLLIVPPPSILLGQWSYSVSEISGILIHLEMMLYL